MDNHCVDCYYYCILKRRDHTESHCCSVLGDDNYYVEVEPDDMCEVFTPIMVKTVRTDKLPQAESCIKCGKHNCCSLEDVFGRLNMDLTQTSCPMHKR